MGTCRSCKSGRIGTTCGIAAALFSQFSLVTMAIAQNGYTPGSPFMFKSVGQSPNSPSPAQSSDSNGPRSGQTTFLQPSSSSGADNGPPAGQATFLQPSSPPGANVDNGPPSGQATFMQPGNSQQPTTYQQQSRYGQPGYPSPPDYDQGSASAALGRMPPVDNRSQIRFMMRNNPQMRYNPQLVPQFGVNRNMGNQMTAGGGMMNNILTPVDRSPISDVGSFLKEDFPLPSTGDDTSQFELPALTKKAFGGYKERTFRSMK